MRRVLVPLDGTELAASILPDARRVAGPGGTLILIQNAEPPTYVRGTRSADTISIDSAYDYLDAVARDLESDGMRVETHVMVLGRTAVAIDEAAAIYGADMVAVATHGRSPLGRLVHGSVAWRAIAHSPVPVLLRHPDRPVSTQPFTGPRRIMVPLDGSSYSERAVGLACQLASETSGEVVLVEVLPTIPGYAALGAAYGAAAVAQDGDEEATQQYLDGIAGTLACRTRTLVQIGPISSKLIETARRLHVTDVVLASHGRTGLSRVVLGSVTDDLIQHLHCPIVVLPVLSAQKVQRSPAEQPDSRSFPHRIPITPMM